MDILIFHSNSGKPKGVVLIIFARQAQRSEQQVALAHLCTIYEQRVLLHTVCLKTLWVPSPLKAVAVFRNICKWTSPTAVSLGLINQLL